MYLMVLVMFLKHVLVPLSPLVTIAFVALGTIWACNYGQATRLLSLGGLGLYVLSWYVAPTNVSITDWEKIPSAFVLLLACASWTYAAFRSGFFDLFLYALVALKGGLETSTAERTSGV